MPSHSISVRSVFILSFNMLLSLPSGQFPSGFLTKTLHALPWSSHPPWFGRPHRQESWKQNLLGNLMQQSMGHRLSYHSMCGHIESCQSDHSVMFNMLSANGINHTLWFLNVSTVQHRGSLLWSKLLSLLPNMETQDLYCGSLYKEDILEKVSQQI
jgi:hypothetical protein